MRFTSRVRNTRVASFTSDRLLQVHEAVPDRLQELVESAHLLHQHGVHTLLIARGVFLQRYHQVVILRQLRQDVGRDVVDDLLLGFLAGLCGGLADILAKIRGFS